MKKTTLLTAPLLFLLFILGSFTQRVNEPAISFEKTTHDFGTMKQNSTIEYEFMLSNKGTAPLIISDVVKTCGCTVPSWPKEPIRPGGTAVIKVTYDSKRVGQFNKEVIVKTNDPAQPEIRLRITGNVEAVEGGGAPVRTNNGGVPGGN
jgi:hypothetical protein